MKLPTPLVPVSGQDGIACLVDAQWSPDGQTIAVLGYQHGCPTASGSESGIVNLYNARSGVLASRWRTDEIILSILNAPEPSAGATPVNPLESASESQGDSRLLAITYRSIAWSPDELSLAVSFSTSLQQKSYNGILLIHITSQQGQVFLQPQNPAHPQPIEWDMFDGQPVPLSPLSPALAYQWKANGELAPVAILSDASITHLPRPDPIGNPDGSSAFSIWQPGFSALTNIFGLSVWSTSFSAWSPGGRYFIDGINVLGLIVAPGYPAPDAQTVASLRLENFRLIPARDLALVKAASTSPVVAWRPDGRILAAYNFYNVSLYDCRTGQKIATLPLQDEQQRIEGTTALLRWSPDGSHLLLSSSLGSVITIWGSDTLPTT